MIFLYCSNVKRGNSSHSLTLTSLLKHKSTTVPSVTLKYIEDMWTEVSVVYQARRVHMSRCQKYTMNTYLAKQWLLTLLSMYYLLQTTRFNRWFKLCSKYEKIQLMGHFRSPLIVILNIVKSTMVVLICRLYDVYRYIRHPREQLSDQVGLTTQRNYKGYAHTRFRVRLGPGISYIILRRS